MSWSGAGKVRHSRKAKVQNDGGEPLTEAGMRRPLRTEQEEGYP